MITSLKRPFHLPLITVFSLFLYNGFVKYRLALKRLFNMTPEYITVHCSATPADRDIGVDEIRHMHLNNGWRDIGYHFVIRRDGLVEPGRPLNQTGAHVGGYNRNNIGVCLVGGVDGSMKAEDNFTDSQFDALRFLITELSGNYAIEESNILGHRDWPDVKKDCPCFDVKTKLEEWK